MARLSYFPLFWEAAKELGLALCADGGLPCNEGALERAKTRSGHVLRITCGCLWRLRAKSQPRLRYKDTAISHDPSCPDHKSLRFIRTGVCTVCMFVCVPACLCLCLCICVSHPPVCACVGADTHMRARARASNTQDNFLYLISMHLGASNTVHVHTRSHARIHACTQRRMFQTQPYTHVIQIPG